MSFNKKRKRPWFMKRRWYHPKLIGYYWIDRYKCKWAENFLHMINGEPQTDMKGNPLTEEQLTIKIRI